MIRPDPHPSADMETLSPEDQAMIDRITRTPRSLLLPPLTPAEPARATWIAAAVSVAGLIGLASAVWWAVKLYVGGV